MFFWILVWFILFDLGWFWDEYLDLIIEFLVVDWFVLLVEEG